MCLYVSVCLFVCAGVRARSVEPGPAQDTGKASIINNGSPIPGYGDSGLLHPGARELQGFSRRLAGCDATDFRLEQK